MYRATLGIAENIPPFWFARIGSHAERDVLLSASGVFDGVAFNANLVEATPGACYALVGNRLRNEGTMPYLIDPMTHAFALPPHYLRSEQLNRRTGEIESKVRRTFNRLADKYGEPFSTAVGNMPLIPGNFIDPLLQETVATNVLQYQNQILEAQRQEEDGVPPVHPAVLIPPYFCITSSADNGWLQVNLEFAQIALHLASRPVFPVICFDRQLLQVDGYTDHLLAAYRDIECDGYFVWVNNFPEPDAGIQEIRSLLRLVEGLTATGRHVFGYFSGILGLAMGFSGIVHAIGYGESKDVVPVLGGGPVRARFYYPPLKRFLPYSEAYEMVRSLSVSEYRTAICNCGVCNELIQSSVDDEFGIFGELEAHGPAAFDRPSQTKRSIVASRLHFASNRYRELTQVRTGGPEVLITSFQDALDRLSPTQDSRSLSHLARWVHALS